MPIMFSKLFKSAKTVLQPAAAPSTLQYPETDLFPPTPAPKTPARTNMVATRNKASAELVSDVEMVTPSAQIQASSRKRQHRDITSTPAASQDVTEVEPSSSTKKRRRSKNGTVLESHSEVQIPVKEVIDLEAAEEKEEIMEVTPLAKRRRFSGVNEGKIKEQRKILKTEKSPAKESMISLASDEEEELKPKASSQPVQSLISDDEEELKPNTSSPVKPLFTNDKEELKPETSSQPVQSLISDDEEELEPKRSSPIKPFLDNEEELKPKTSSQPVQSLISDDEEVEQPKSTKKGSSPTQPKKAAPTEKKIAGKKSQPVKIEQKAAKEIVELPKPKHRKFGSEEPVMEIPSSDPIDNEDIEEGEESSSDDEAPEEVGTKEAAEDAKKVVRAAAKAIEQVRATERKARQDRALALKKQAESNKKRKRKSAPEIEENDEELASKKVAPIANAEKPDIDIAMEDAPETISELLPTKKSRTQKIDEHNLPDLLPLEYLEDAPADLTTLSLPESTQPRAKKTKFLDEAEKKIRDKKKGSTTFRVRESEGDKRLAPKASKESRGLKEAWLSGGGRRGGSGRKAMKSGFLVGGKGSASRR